MQFIIFIIILIIENIKINIIINIIVIIKKINIIVMILIIHNLLFFVNNLQKFSNIFWCYKMLLILIMNIDNLFKNNNIFFKWDKNRKINKKNFVSLFLLFLLIQFYFQIIMTAYNEVDKFSVCFVILL